MGVGLEEHGGNGVGLGEHGWKLKVEMGQGEKII